MSEASIRVGEAVSEAEHRAILDGLKAFNAGFLGPSDHLPLSVTARAGGDLLGGLIGETGRGWLTIDLLWVDGACRRKGLGSTLLLAAESEARRRGCRHARLWTFDFQARPFYERHGFVRVFELDGYPNGHRSLLMRKAIPGAEVDDRAGGTISRRRSGRDRAT